MQHLSLAVQIMLQRAGNETTGREHIMLQRAGNDTTGREHTLIEMYRIVTTHTKQNVATCKGSSPRLAFPISAHQNATKSQSEVCLNFRCSVHFHPSLFTRPSHLIYRSFASITRMGESGQRPP